MSSVTPELIAYVRAVQSILASHDFSTEFDVHEDDVLLDGYTSALDASACARQLMAARSRNA